MPKFKTDLRDIEFNLFELLKIQEKTQFGLGEGDFKAMLTEHDKFVENEVFPTREKSDEIGVKLVDGHVKVPEILLKMHKGYHENGWFAMGFPEEVGGAPVPEAFCIGCMSVATGANTGYMMYPGLTRGNLNVIRTVGTQEQKDLYIPNYISGKWGGTMCLTEPGAGSDVGAARTTAKKLDNGKYAISGTKIFISSGDSDLYENTIHLVLARTPDAPEGTKGLSLFIVPKYRINEDGSNGELNDVQCKKVEHKMGIHCSATCELMFGENGSCEGELIGEECEGMTNMFIMMNEARLYVGLQGEAQANLAYMLTEQYVKERSQFGTEIVNHPDVKKTLLKMRAMARGLRALCLYQANLFDDAKGNPEQEAEIGLLTPLVKSYCSDQGFFLASEAVQMHGGYGYCTEYGVEQFIRDTKIAAIYEGTNGIQAIDFVTRKVLKDQGQALQRLMAKVVASVKKSCRDGEFNKEVELFNKVLSSGEKVMGHIANLAKEKKIPLVLQHCTDFQNFTAQLVVAWRLLDSAILAHEVYLQAMTRSSMSLKLLTLKSIVAITCLIISLLLRQ
jgi:alkylation response protein AidB-like acyl-CoA dehydrogenase